MSALGPSTRLVGLIGWPVAHSRSPAMHNAAFGTLGLDWGYVGLAVSPDRLGEAVRGLRGLGFAGANVTVPHKRAVMEHLDHLEPAAKLVGAVNTIVVEPDGRLVGTNTDAAGLRAALKAHHVALDGQKVMVLGAGGAARAAVVACAEGAEVRVCNRSAERAEALVADLQGGLRAAVAVVPWQDRHALSDLDLVINATSLGMHPHEDRTPLTDLTALSANAVVYDMVYTPRPTALLRRAEGVGATAIDGLSMLLYQGALAFERWTGREAPLDVMRAALMASR